MLLYSHVCRNHLNSRRAFGYPAKFKSQLLSQLAGHNCLLRQKLGWSLEYDKLICLDGQTGDDLNAGCTFVWQWQPRNCAIIAFLHTDMDMQDLHVNYCDHGVTSCPGDITLQSGTAFNHAKDCPCFTTQENNSYLCNLYARFEETIAYCIQATIHKTRTPDTEGFKLG